MLIVTLPAVTNPDLADIIAHPQVGAVRYNVGMRTPFSPRDTLDKIEKITRIEKKLLWVDLKGRQLRIVRWADPDYGEMELNHSLSVDLPATVVFRGGFRSTIVGIEGNKIYIAPNPKEALGAGQAVNILGRNLVIDGYLTDTDVAYIKAAGELGLNHFMLSFAESESDIASVVNINPKADVVLKIESSLGVSLVNRFDPRQWKNCRLMAARDDLMIQLNASPSYMLRAVKRIIERDKTAIAASHLLTSLQHGPVSAADLSDLYLLYQWGYRDFLLSDTISHYYLPQAFQVWRDLMTVVDKL